MAITRVQAVSSQNTGVTLTNPSWGTNPVAGNLLIYIINESTHFSSWTPTLNGWTAVSGTPFSYYTGGPAAQGMYWKIAAGGGSDGFPTITDSSSSAVWTAYGYEFNAPNGWNSSPVDGNVHSAASSTAGTSKASGSTGLLAQPDELSFVMAAESVAVTGLTFATNTYTVDNPSTAFGMLWGAWLETSTNAAQQTTASWTTSARAGVWVVTFKTAATGWMLTTNHGSGTAASGTAFSIGTAQNVGDLMVVALFNINGTYTVSGISDTVGTSYSSYVFTSGGTTWVYCWGFLAGTGANSFTITWSGGTSGFGDYAEFTGTSVSGSVIDGTGHGAEGTAASTVTTPTITTTGTDDLVLNFFFSQGGTTSVGSPWSTAATGQGILAYLPDVGASTYTPNGAITASGVWGSICIAFKAPTIAAVTPFVPFRMPLGA